MPNAAMDTISYTHDLPGDTFRLLSTDVAYLKLSSVKVADVPHYIELAHDSNRPQGWRFDGGWGLILRLAAWFSRSRPRTGAAHKLVDCGVQFETGILQVVEVPARRATALDSGRPSFSGL